MALAIAYGIYIYMKHRNKTKKLHNENCTIQSLS
jgi:hypothetical protein